MHLLMLTLAGVGVAAAAVTWFALMSAKEGYEDETGFHFASREKQRRPQTAAPSAAPVGPKDSPEVPPCAPAR